MEGKAMLIEYCQEALNRAHYEIIDDPIPYYGEIPDLPGVWAQGNSLEECRNNLTLALEDWLFMSVAKGLPIPDLGECSLPQPQKVAA